MLNGLRWFMPLLLGEIVWSCAAYSYDDPPLNDGKPQNDAGTRSDDAGVYGNLLATGDACVSDGTSIGVAKALSCTAKEVCDDGLDNDCNGMVDEGCFCEPGRVQKCFRGPPGRRGIGTCADGMQTCQGSGEFGQWSDCQGGVSPGVESCDAADNDCDGRIDNGLCCHAEGSCPAMDDPRVPVGAPFVTYSLNGSDFFHGRARQWRWRVVGGPCDQLLFASRKHVSYKLQGASDTEPRETVMEKLTFVPMLSGDYVVTLTATPESGPEFECTFLAKIRANGFRAELCWDRTGEADLDLWVHQPGNVSNWGTVLFGNSTCSTYNCKNNFPTYSANWGYPPTPGMGCSQPIDVGCKNPRLDIDNQRTPGIPENINVDVPNNGDTFRVAVNYYNYFGPAGSERVQPMVNIYCGGALRGTYGGAQIGQAVYGPTPVANFVTPGSNESGSFWRVVDVQMHEPADTCDLMPLVPRGARSGACVTNDTDRSFTGPCEVRK